ncbi:hypothetical protein [Streptomyces sp. WM6386]|uniref:hypothetical protein n=1 Tax=Streptomyces sp. WM6386 TaxID=1415558 RepID=UPI00131BE738|nr:hypothetical protein [Streptomyces sp. WM6386]
MTELRTMLVVLGMVLVIMACVKSDRVRGWRASLYPSGEELPARRSSSRASSS